MSAPLLKVDKLTLRFGGLTAVSEVDLRVEEGQIAAVIGPNGAGKTSLFNAITGIYEPTSGEVQLDGKDLQEPMQPRLLLRWMLVGLGVGLIGLLTAANVDSLWAAVIKSQDPNAFSATRALHDAGAYMTAQPRVDLRMAKYFVASFDGQTTFAVVKTPELAATALADAQKRLDNPQTDDDKATAARAVSALQVRGGAFLAGLLLGFLAARAVWQRTRRTPTSVALRGVARTFQNIRLFHNMTVIENVLVASDRHLRAQAKLTDPGRLTAILAPAGLLALTATLALVVRKAAPDAAETLPVLVLAALMLGLLAWLIVVVRRGAFSSASLNQEKAAKSEATELLKFVGLEHRLRDLARNLPYGEQRRLEIARALATRPRLLLLDEPAAGMNPSETVSLMHLIRAIRDRGTTVLLIEHHMRVVMGISDRITVLVHGKRIAEGTPDEIRQNPAVIEAYLGADGEH